MSKMSIEPGGLIRHALNGETMGTRYSAVFYAPTDRDTTLLAAALFAVVDQVDCQMSTWKPDSDLNRLNAVPVGAWVPIPRELMAVLAEALRIGKASQGAFDIGVGDMVAAWGFGPHASGVATGVPAPTPRFATHTCLELDVPRLHARKLAPVTLDLSGIAKGFGVDELARVMVAFGISTWLVGIDGEMRGSGAKPDGAPWAIAHERPVRGVREAMGVIELTDLAVATSGNYRHFREVDGKIVSHTMDARKGIPLDNGIASVTVLAPTCMEADAWATAFMVMGEKAGLGLARLRGMEAIFVRGDGTMVSS